MLNRLALVLCALFAHVEPAAAVVQTPFGTATVSSVEDNIGAVPEVQPGSVVAFVYGFETTREDLEPDESIGFYLGDTESLFQVWLGEQLLAECAFSDIIVENDSPEFDDDSYFVASDLESCGAPTIDISILMLDASKTVFDSDALPTALELADFDEATLLIDGCPAGNPECNPETEGFSVFAEIDSFQYAPEASAETLGMTGLVALAGLTRRRGAAPVPLRR